MTHNGINRGDGTEAHQSAATAAPHLAHRSRSNRGRGSTANAPVEEELTEDEALVSSPRDDRPFTATCRTCGVETAARDPNEIVAFYRRHNRLTDHEVEWVEPGAGFDFTLPTDGDVEGVLLALEAQYVGEGNPMANDVPELEAGAVVESESEEANENANGTTRECGTQDTCSAGTHRRSGQGLSDGVPIGAYTAAMAEQGFGIGEALDALYEMRIVGKLYEPWEDHVRVV